LTSRPVGLYRWMMPDFRVTHPRIDSRTDSRKRLPTTVNYGRHRKAFVDRDVLRTRWADKLNPQLTCRHPGCNKDDTWRPR
jgi:hypothetical protein